MKDSELKVVRFDDADVIATSSKVAFGDAFNTGAGENVRAADMVGGTAIVSRSADFDFGKDVPNGMNGGVASVSGLEDVIKILYGPDYAELDETELNGLYSQIKSANFRHSGVNSNVRTEDGYLWYDKNGNGDFDNGEKITFTDVIRSTTGTQRDIALTNELYNVIGKDDIIDSNKLSKDPLTVGLEKITVNDMNNNNRVVNSNDFNKFPESIVVTVTADDSNTLLNKLGIEWSKFGANAGDTVKIKYVDPAFLHPDQENTRIEYHPKSFIVGDEGGEQSFAHAGISPDISIGLPVNLAFFANPAITEGEESEELWSQKAQVDSLSDVFQNSVWSFVQNGDDYEFVHDPNYVPNDIPTDIT